MLEKEIFTITSSEEFEQLALQVFRYQHQHTSVYHEFCNFLKIEPSRIQTILDIPFLPIQFFKSHRVISKEVSETMTFISSGTTGSTTSKHLVADLNLYKKSFSQAFQENYGDPSNYVILALLPSYLEREDSSLIYMVDHLIKDSHNPNSGFYLDNMSALIEKLKQQEEMGQKTILLGVSYALLDLIELQSFNLKNTTIIETGGMKGRRKELVKVELHQILKKGFGVSRIHSEYGMTELLSQAYSKGNGIFTTSSWMKILTRDPEDALSFNQGKTGGINVIDLANLYSCSFIATQDLGKTYSDASFEIIGRFDISDIRGCNLMMV